MSKSGSYTSESSYQRSHGGHSRGRFFERFKSNNLIIKASRRVCRMLLVQRAYSWHATVSKNNCEEAQIQAWRTLVETINYRTSNNRRFNIKEFSLHNFPILITA